MKGLVFTTRLAERKQLEPDHKYFERLVAKAILFRRAEKLVHEQKFGGYRANIVTYSLALILNRTSQRIDLERIWCSGYFARPSGVHNHGVLGRSR